MFGILIFRSVSQKLLPYIFLLFSLTSQIKGGKNICIFSDMSITIQVKQLKKGRQNKNIFKY